VPMCAPSLTVKIGRQWQRDTTVLPAEGMESTMSTSPSSPNGLLASLIPADFDLVRPYLKPIEFKNETVLYSAGDHAATAGRWRPALVGCGWKSGIDAFRLSPRHGKHNLPVQLRVRSSPDRNGIT
jgi:hypothetical protein